jgi:hypothetical protein
MAVKKRKTRKKLTQKQLLALKRGREKLSKKKTPPIKKKVKNKVIKVIENKQTVSKKGIPKMAKRKSKKAKTTRVMSGIASRAKGLTPVVKNVALAVGGAVAAGAIANKLPLTNPKLKAATPMIGGILLAGTFGKRNQMLKDVGTGMAVIGALSLLKQFMPNVPVLAGEDSIIYLPEGYIPQLEGDYMRLGGDTVRFGQEEEYLSPASM